MELPVGGTVSRDTFETGSRAAAFGGTTTILDFAGQTRGRSLREGLEAWMARAEGRCAIDYGFHMMVNDVNEATLAEMDAFVAEGVTTFKLFTAYPGVQLSDDGAILRAMLRSGENGGLVLMHAENGVAIDVLAERLALAGRTEPWYHGVSRHAGLRGRVRRTASSASRSPRTCPCTSSTSARGMRSRRSCAAATAGPASTPRPARSTSS